MQPPGESGVTFTPNFRQEEGVAGWGNGRGKWELIPRLWLLCCSCQKYIIAGNTGMILIRLRRGKQTGYEKIK